MSIHQTLVARGGGYARWHKLPYATVMHFLVLTIVMSFVALHLEKRLLERVDDFTTGNYDIDHIPS